MLFRSNCFSAIGRGVCSDGSKECGHTTIIGMVRANPTTGECGFTIIYTYQRTKMTYFKGVETVIGLEGGVEKCTAQYGYRKATDIMIEKVREEVREVRKLTRRYTFAIAPIIGADTDIPAPDVNTNSQTMAWI